MATQIPEHTAKKAAVSFLNSISDAKPLLTNELQLLYGSDGFYYVFGTQNTFVIIAADDIAKPVLGYGEHFKIPSDTTYGANFFGLLKSFEKQILFAHEQGISQNAEISKLWKDLENGSHQKDRQQAIEPLMTTTWGQGWPYNADCPDASGGPGGHVWTGCVATALAQILHYTYSNESDFQGVGSYSYTWGGYPTTSVNFGNTSYDMASMPNAVSNITDPGATEIAKLSYHVGVGCRAMWGSGSTGVLVTSNDNPMVALLQNYLPTAASAEYIQKMDYTDADWHNTIQSELTAGRVVYYRGDGSLSHAWVCDGVNASNFYHFNFGWDGSYNGYYSLSAINPGGNTLTNNQAAIIGIKANDGTTLVSDATWSTNQTLSSNIVVPDAVTLTINPGVVVSFGEGYGMRVWGRLLSIGTANNYAKFTASNPTLGWTGIHYQDDYMKRMMDNDSSKFIYTQIEYSKSSGLYCQSVQKMRIEHAKINDNHSDMYGGGVYIFDSPISVLNSEIYNNDADVEGGGLFVYSSGTISTIVNGNDIFDNTAIITAGGLYSAFGDNIFEENTFTGNYAIRGSAVKVGGSSPKFINCKFLNNETPMIGGMGIFFLLNCSPDIVGSLFANNTGAAIYLQSSFVNVINVTIVNNYHKYASGMIFDLISDGLIKNTIIYGNEAQNPTYGNNIDIIDVDSDPDFVFCNIEGGLAGFGGLGAGANYSGNYQNNIDSDPLFVSPTAGAGISYDASLADFSCQSGSPCINSGDTTNISQYLPDYDLDGNPRIVDEIDMGAYEHGQDPVILQQPVSLSLCAGEDALFTIEAQYTQTYQWFKNSDSIIGATNDSLLLSTVSISDTGNYYCMASNNFGDATSETATLSIALPPQIVNILGDDEACQGDTIVFVADTMENLYDSYQWSVPSGMEIVSPQGLYSVDVSVIESTSPGEISCYASNQCGNGPTGTHSLSVNPLPAAAETISGDTDVCREEEGLVYSVDPITNATDYIWQLPDGFSITAGANTAAITVALSADAQNGTISIYATNACGEGQSSELSVNVHFVTAEAGEDQSINYGQSTQLDGTIDGDGTIDILWTTNNSGWTSTEEDPITENLSATTQFTMQVSNDFGCLADDDMVVNVQGGALSVIAVADPEEICSGESSLLSAQTSGGTGTYTFNWSSDPAGFTSTEQGPEVFPTENTTYTVEVNDGNETVSDYTSVIVNPLPGDAGDISGDSDVCRGEEDLIYSIEPISNAADYNWQLPEGFSITAGANTASITVSISDEAQSGEIAVFASNACGAGQNAALFVHVHYVTADAGEDQSINYGQSTQLDGTIDGDGNIDILWTTNNSSWTSTQEDPTTEALTATTLFTLEASNEYGCIADDDVIISVIGGPLGVTAIADPTEICIGENSQLTALVSGGTGNYTYNWSSDPAGFSSTEQNPVVSPTQTSTYTVVVNDGNESVSSETTVTVNMPPANPAQPAGPDMVDLKLTSSSEYTATEVAGAQSYIWNLEPISAGELQATDNTLSINWSPDFLGYCSLSVAAANDCGQSEYSDALEIYVDYIDGINNPQQAEARLYPNPGTGLFHLHTAKNISEISILDISGRVLEIKELSTEPSLEYLIDMQSYCEGIYILQLTGTQYQMRIKLIKQ